MNKERKINTALISVYHKDNLEPIIKELNNLNVTIFSTGGTKTFIEEYGIDVTGVEDLTSYPSILGGRVKTLHPKVFGGILARREEEEDIAQLSEYDIPQIDLVIVDLYPFIETVANETDENIIIEKIDIGGISLIRAAAKNFKDVLVISSRDDYKDFLKLLKEKGGFSDMVDRKEFGKRAFAVSANYDKAIFDHFNQGASEETPGNIETSNTRQLRYGENPHQKGYFHGNLDDLFEQLHGKELSYNNLVDIDGAVSLIEEFEDPTFAIIKHTNACGVASRDNQLTCWEDALAGDPVSAFGGIIACNQMITKDVAAAINTLFFEVIAAPGYEPEALELLKQKKNRRILVQKKKLQKATITRSNLNGTVEQDNDLATERSDQLIPKTTQEPSQKEIDDLLFANKVVKHLKSNAIALVKNKQLIGIGVGQTSRIDALNQAIAKAANLGFETRDAVMASDAFFPFSDCVEIAHNAGIRAIIQPGGSVKDQESIDYCEKNGITMVFTGVRHFRH